MAKILYSLAQSGRGHASRGYEIIRRLAEQGHKIMVLTGGDTYEPLDIALQGMRNVSLHKLPGLMQFYHKSGKLDYAKMVSKNLPTLFSSDIIIKKLKKLIDTYDFDFAISDFEPFMPRAAKSRKIRFITLDNQHKIVFCKRVAKRLRAKHIPSYLVAKSIIQSAHPLGCKCIITSVFKPKLRKKKIRKTQISMVGPIIRNEVEQLKKKVSQQDFVLVYVKPALERAIIPVLRQIGQKFVMYVKKPETKRKSRNIIYKAHSADKFAHDLARCKAVVSSAGEQLMSEALYLGKPVFLMPEGGQFEQIMNGYSVKEAGVGDYKDINAVEKEDILGFLKKLSAYRKNIKRMRIRNDIDKIMGLINEELNKKPEKKKVRRRR